MTVQSASAVLSIAVIAIIAVVFLNVLGHSRKPGDNDAIQARAGRIRVALFSVMVVVGLPVSIWLLRATPYMPAAAQNQVVNVSGGQWYWDLDRDELPVGQPIEFRVTSVDVNHGFGIYDASGRMLAQTQAMPEYVNRLVYTFDQPGTYRILCLEFCGVAHHGMVTEFTVQ